MEHLKYNGASVSHGFKVGIGTLASTASLELLLAAPIESLDIDACVAKWKSWEETEKEILRIFDGKPGFIDRALTETKNKYVDKEGLRRELTAFKAAWPELKERIRKQIIPFEEVRRRLKLVGAPYEPEQLGVSRARFLSLRVHGRVARTAVRQGRYLGSRVARCLLSGCDGSTAGIRLRKEPEETIKFIITYEFSLIVLFGLIDGKPDAVKHPAFSFESIFGRESTICSEHAYLCKTLVPYN